ncbi:unnamed protein product [Moneuplotes crassus]|uniref:Uncharacterized protein n=1 Tax=Euplotes crassus TaxID=5936 RepID=A0AAD1YBM1_EUPCR|nr:unnamed protein product [Moneuplotes crassus]
MKRLSHVSHKLYSQLLLRYFLLIRCNGSVLQRTNRVIWDLQTRLAFLITLLSLIFVTSAAVDYEWKIQKLQAGETTVIEENIASNPRIYVHYTTSGGSVLGNEPSRTPMGLLYGDQAASSINYSPRITLSGSFTISFWVYILEPSATSAVFCQSTSAGARRICFFYDGGKMKIITVNAYTATGQTLTSSTIGSRTGWNVLSLASDGTNFVVRNIHRGDSTLFTESFTQAAYTSDSYLTIGGENSNGAIINSFNGMINKMFYSDYFVSNSDLTTLLKIPGKDECPISFCEYYKTEFFGINRHQGVQKYIVNRAWFLPTQTTAAYNEDSMSFASNNNGIIFDTTKQLYFAEIYNPSDKNFGFEIWFTGDIGSSGEVFFHLYAVSTTTTLFKCKRSSDNLICENSVATYTFTNAFTGHVNNKWTMIYIGFGPLTNSHNRFGVCVYIKQPDASLSFSECQIPASDDFSPLYPAVSTFFNLTLGLGMDGYMGNFYITNRYLKYPEVFDVNDIARTDNRRFCNENTFEQSPFCISEAGCGNGIVDTGEQCDDSNHPSRNGCDSSCNEEYKYECFESSRYGQTFCYDRCGNGRSEAAQDEECDDDNRSSGDGCNSSCKLEVGYTHTVTEGQLSTHVPICGDQIKVPQEQCDDNDINDGEGCRSDCAGALQGWTCDSASPSVCSYTINDGIRAINKEDCDDGNNDDNDGCSTLGVIDPKYSCQDDLVGKSICVLKCGDGIVEASLEECDDENIVDGDGCSSTCTVESGYSCVTNSSGQNVCHKNVKMSLESISDQNVAMISFNSDMEIFEIATSDLSVVVTGPANNYDLSYTSKFTNSTHLEVDVKMISTLYGGGSETMNITIDQSKFKSSNGASVENNSVKGIANQILENGAMLNACKSATSSMLQFTMGIIISTNVLLGDSLDLHWAFMNTLQLLYYYPFFSVYFPIHVVSFFKSFTISRFEVDFISNSQNSALDYFISNEKYHLETSNKKFIENDLESSNILRNLSSLTIAFVQGTILCFILLAIKGKFVTAQQYIKQALQEENKHCSNNIDFPASEMALNRNVFSKNLRSSVHDISCSPSGHLDTQAASSGKPSSISRMIKDYKYEFFLRFGIQMYLDACVLSMLDLSEGSFENWMQICSFIISIIILACCLYGCYKLLVFIIKLSMQIHRHPGEVPQGFEVLYTFFKPRSKIYLLYYPFFMIRRLAFAIALITMNHYPFIQCSVVVVSFFSMMLLHVIFRPYKSWVCNAVTCINEIILFCTAVSFYIFHTTEYPAKLMSEVGWMLIGCVFFLVIFNILVLLTIKITTLIQKCQKSTSSSTQTLNRFKNLQRARQALKIQKLEPPLTRNRL